MYEKNSIKHTEYYLQDNKESLKFCKTQSFRHFGNVIRFCIIYDLPTQT